MNSRSRKDGKDQNKDPSEQRLSKERSRENSAVVETLSAAQMPIAVSPPTTGPQHTGWSRLEHLYRISNVFAQLTNVDQTVADVLAVITNIQPLRSAVLIHGTAGRVQLVPWNAKGVNDGEIQAAKQYAMASYEYFLGVTSALEAASRLKAHKKNFIAIPLVVGRSPIFGLLQLEGPTPFNESDLIFLNAIANQLAVALDRYYGREREMFARAQAEEAQRRMHFLAEAGRILSSSLDHEATWESMAQLATGGTTQSPIADLCIIDLLQGEQSASQRTIVVSRDLRERMTEKDAAEALAEVMLKVAATGQSVIYPEVWPLNDESLPPDGDSKPAHIRTLQSYMCVPLELDGTTIGTLTVGWASPGHSYGAPDLALLHDLVLRVVLAFVRARLYRSTVAAVRSRDDLLTIVSHDLRAPLAVILGFSSAFLKTARPGELVSCDPKHIEAIQRSALHMTKLIEDLLSTASIEADHVLIERQMDAAGPLIQEALALMQPLAARKDIHFTTNVADYLPTIFADPDRTMQVFANLIGNAIRFSPVGGAISIGATQIEDCVQFSVEDTGPGIPADQLERIFDRFWQGPGKERKGTGLGLFIVKGIVEAHGGKVWAKSEVGVGSTFFFTVPVFLQDGPWE